MKEIIGYSMAHVPIPLLGFCKLTLNDGTVVELRGKGTLSYNDIVLYRTLATEIEVGKKCTNIEGGFYSFTELVKLTIPSSVTSITLLQAPSITAGCSKLKEINFDAPLPLPSGIAGYYGNSNVDKIIIGPHVTGIAENACMFSRYLTSITIPGNVKYIGQNAFNTCNNLTLVDIRNGCTTVGTNAFYSCPNLISVTIPDSIISIADYAFSNCTALSTVTINSNAVVSKTYSSGSNFKNLFGNQVTEYIIGNSVTSIGDYAFYGCGALVSVNIGSDVASIGNSTFSSCSSLASIISLATTAPTIQNNTFELVKGYGILTVPSGSSGYDVWMETGDYYLGKYGWTKVEQ